MALGAARAVTRREKILVFDGAYHGGVLTLPKAGRSTCRFHWSSRATTTRSTLQQIEREGDQLAAVIIEPMMGAAGASRPIPIPSAPADAATRHGIILIFDEVMTSRLSPGGLQATLGITPDLTTLGKYLGGGLAGAFGGRATSCAGSTLGSPTPCRIPAPTTTTCARLPAASRDCHRCSRRTLRAR